MKSWSPWETTRRQVAIGGRVVDENDRPAVGAQVTVTAMPEALRQKIGAATEKEYLNTSHAQRDGIYFFLDLPPGKYTLKATDRRAVASAEKTVSVSRPKDGKVVMAVADFKLSKVG